MIRTFYVLTVINLALIAWLIGDPFGGFTIFIPLFLLPFTILLWGVSITRIGWQNKSIPSYLLRASGILILSISVALIVLVVFGGGDFSR